MFRRLFRFSVSQTLQQMDFGRGLTIIAPKRQVYACSGVNLTSSSGFGTITQDNISIGPSGLIVDGVRVSSLVNSLSEFVEANEILGSGVSGTVRKVKHPHTNKVFAIKVCAVGSPYQKFVVLSSDCVVYGSRCRRRVEVEKGKCDYLGTDLGKLGRRAL